MKAPIAFDLETWGPRPMGGLLPWAGGGTVTSVAFADAGENTAHWLPALDVFGRLHGRTILGWNLLFDLAWVQRVYGDVDMLFGDAIYIDVMLVWMRLDRMQARYTGKGSYSLKEAVRLHLPELADYEKRLERFATPSDPEDSERVRTHLWYNQVDASATYRLHQKFWPLLSAHEQRAVLVESAAAVELAKSWTRGVPLDVGAILDLAEVTGKRRAELLAEMNVSPEVLASPKQLAKLLYETWGLPCTDYTDKGAPSTDKEALTKLALEYPQLSKLLEYKKLETRSNKFIRGAAECLDFTGDGNAYPAPRICGTYTGRVTYSGSTGRGKDEVASGVAIHQWERTPEVRKIITAPEGWLIGELDFAGQEMRLIADYSQDPMMLSIFQKGLDGHALMGAKVADVPYEGFEEHPQYKRFRQLGKVANLSLQYRTSANTLRTTALVQHGIEIQPHEADKIHSAYRLLYPGVVSWWREAIQTAKAKGYAETRSGRKVALTDWVTDKGWPSEQTAINFPIQGTGGDLKYLALSTLRPFCREYGIQFLFDLHDGLYYLIPSEGATILLKQMRSIASSLDYPWTPSISLPVDAKLGPSWGEMEELA